jgi:hypothetical protein
MEKLGFKHKLTLDVANHTRQNPNNPTNPLVSGAMLIVTDHIQLGYVRLKAQPIYGLVEFC